MKEMINMKISFLPKSRLGTWTAGLNIFFLLVCIFLYIFAELKHVIISDSLIGIVGATSLIALVTVFFTGIIAVIKNKERSVLVFLAILIGSVILAFILGGILGLPDV